MRLTDTEQQLGIGELSEKSVHHFLKNYIEPDKSKQEVNLGYGVGVADILRENESGQKEAFEIQTKSFFKLKKKLAYYINTGMTVTIVYPTCREKVIHWVEPVTGEIIEQRKSQVKKTKHEVFSEMHGIRKYLPEIQNGNLRFRVYELQVDEYKYLDGYGVNNKKRATKIDKVPSNIIDIVQIENKNDFKKFIPLDKITKDSRFTAKDYAKLIRCHVDLARTELLVLYNLGLVERVGKQDRQYLYRINF